MRRLAFVLLAASLAACRGRAPAAEASPGAPVILISVDTLRADHLPAYGYAKVETPALDALQHDSVVFDNAYSHCPLTLPSHASILTGLLPAQHGVRDNIGYRLAAPRHPTLARLLKSRGYATGGAVSAYVLRAATGIADGFDVYDDAVGAPAEAGIAASLVQRPGSETEQRALDWARSVSARPFFLFLHLYEPHAPYDPPEPWRSRYGRTYDGEIAAADAIVGDFLGALKRDGIYDGALVVFLSDHGEGLGDHGEQEHGILLYREALRVPLFVKLPHGRRGGSRVARPVGLVDVLPTVVAALDLPRPDTLAGVSLLGPAPAAERRIASETWYPRIHLGWSDLRSLIDARFHFIDGPRPELYDVGADPAEVHDAVATHPATVEAMAAELRAVPAGFEAPGPVDAESAERLKSLGYLSGTATVAPGVALPNPRDTIHVHEQLEAAFRSARDGDDRTAAETLQAVLAGSPRSFDAEWALAGSLARLGRTEDAVRSYNRAMTLSPSLAGSVALDLARLLIARADRGRALAVLDTAHASIAHGALAPVPGLEATRGDLLARAKRYPDAEAAFRGELGAFPASAHSYANLAVVQALAGRSRGEVRATIADMVKAVPGAETRRLAAQTLTFVGDAQGAAAWNAGL